MPATIYYDSDADLSVLSGKTIAVIGYGSQGHAQAQNLRDSGLNVVVAQRPGGPNFDLAKSHGFEPLSVEEAVKQADVVNILLPDELQGDVNKRSIKPNLKAGAVLMARHGFNFHFNQVEPPPGHDILLVRRKVLVILFEVSTKKVVVFPVLSLSVKGLQRKQKRSGWLMRKA